MNKEISVYDLEEYEKDRDRFLWFLYQLEDMGILESEFKEVNNRTERVWRAKHE